MIKRMMLTTILPKVAPFFPKSLFDAITYVYLVQKYTFLKKSSSLSRIYENLFHCFPSITSKEVTFAQNNQT
jgi:hypothetical protein